MYTVKPECSDHSPFQAAVSLTGPYTVVYNTSCTQSDANKYNSVSQYASCDMASHTTASSRSAILVTFNVGNCLKSMKMQ